MTTWARPEDSDRRCPHCSKRMMLEVGQNDVTDGPAVGETQVIHHCWSCGYVERDNQWRRKRVVVGSTMAERLHQARRDGWTVPLRTDLPAVEEVEQWG